MDIAYIYCRVSSKAQNNMVAGHISLKVQIDLCEKYAESKGMYIEDTVEEIGSGRNVSKQKHLLELIDEITTLNCGSYLLIANVSRFSRSTSQGLMLLDKLLNAGCTVCFVQENVEYNSVAGKQHIRMLLSNSEYESDLISQRVKSAFDFKKQQGSKLGCPPYGYSAVRNNGIRSFVINNNEWKIISFICDIFNCNKSSTELTSDLEHIKGTKQDPIFFFDERGKKTNKITQISKSDIADLLNDYGITKRGKLWTGNKVSHIIKKFSEEEIFSKKKRTRRPEFLSDSSDSDAMDFEEVTETSSDYDSDDELEPPKKKFRRLKL